MLVETEQERKPTLEMRQNKRRQDQVPLPHRAVELLEQLCLRKINKAHTFSQPFPPGITNNEVNNIRLWDERIPMEVGMSLHRQTIRFAFTELSVIDT